MLKEDGKKRLGANLSVEPVRKQRQLFVSDPHGYCAGVRRSVNMLKKLVELFPDRNVYVRKELVHNTRVIDKFSRQNVIFADSILDIPDGEVALFSAHGVAPTLYKLARLKKLKFYDAVCPLVMKIHSEVSIKARHGYHILVIGKRNHDEIEGILGVFNQGDSYTLLQNKDDCILARIPENKKLFCVTQSTLSVQEVGTYLSILKDRFPKLELPKRSDICYATENRQTAILNLITKNKIDAVIVVTSHNSSNGMQLYKECKKIVANTHVTDHFYSTINPFIFEDVRRIAITSSASTPEESVDEITKILKDKVGVKISRYLYKKESISFKEKLIML